MCFVSNKELYKTQEFIFWEISVRGREKNIPEVE